MNDFFEDISSSSIPDNSSTASNSPENAEGQGLEVNIYLSKPQDFAAARKAQKQAQRERAKSSERRPDYVGWEADLAERTRKVNAAGERTWEQFLESRGALFDMGGGFVAVALHKLSKAEQAAYLAMQERQQGGWSNV